MASLEEKKKLIRTIKTPNRYFRLVFNRYGGEVAMGSITQAQFDHWEDHDGFEEYMAAVDWDAEEANKDIPEEAQFDRPFYEYEDICHLSGPEWAESQTLYIEEVNKDGQPLEKDDGSGYVEDLQYDYGDLESLGVDVECTETYNQRTIKGPFVFGQHFNKGSWHTEVIKTGADGIIFDKMKIRYVNADGFNVFNEIEYDGEVYYLEEDSTGKSSSYYVGEGLSG